MAKVAILDDSTASAEFLAAPFSMAGHTAHATGTPIDWERVLNFGPEIVVVTLFRRRAAFNRPITQPDEDILGCAVIEQIERYPAIQLVPIILVGFAVEESDLSLNLNYDLFLILPEDLGLILPKVDQLSRTPKTRRRISGYVCPVCRSRLTFVREPPEDLFCPRCGTSVAIIDERRCLYQDPAGQPHDCTIDQILPPRRP